MVVLLPAERLCVVVGGLAERVTGRVPDAVRDAGKKSLIRVQANVAGCLFGSASLLKWCVQPLRESAFGGISSGVRRCCGVVASWGLPSMVVVRWPDFPRRADSQETNSRCGAG